MNSKIIVFCILFLTFTRTQAQQILPPQSNGILKTYLQAHPDIDLQYGKRILGKTNSSFDSLPFFEDFTQSKVVPDTSKWVDRNVYINNGFAKNPPSYNVATFDGLDKEGNAYKLITGFDYGAADTFTSVPLNFTSYTSANNIYISFFYQRRGYGDQPQKNDSLLLQFLTFGGKWNTVWSKEGGVSESNFTQVILPITSANYFHGAFQFRFVNYASLTGNLNHWNIDYIRIDRNRSASDTLINDVAIMTLPTPLLKRYYSMPYNQYKANPGKENADSTSFYVRNLNNTNVQVSSKNFLFNKAFGNQLGTTNTFTLGLLNYQTPKKISYSFNTQIDTLGQAGKDTFILKSLYTSSENSDVRRINDSATKEQLFANYYAYDDGSAEAGFGIDFGAGKVALRFETNIPDTLRAIDVYFNQSIKSNSGLSFTLTTWSTLSPVGQPANQDIVTHFQTYTVPDHNYSYRDGMGGFTRIFLDTPRAIAAGKFYIGWRQNSQFMLNVGFDFNYPDNFGTSTNPNAFVNTTGSWEQLPFAGTVMMRPVLGKEATFVGIHKKPIAKTGAVHVYPNPAHALIYVDKDPDPGMRLTISDVQGRVIRETPFENAVLDVKDLSQGIYILNIFDPSKNQIYTTKFSIL